MNDSYGSEGEYLGKVKGKMSNVAVVKAERDWAVRIIGGIIVLFLTVLGFMARDISGMLWTVKDNQIGVMKRLDAVENGMRDLKDEVIGRFVAHEAKENEQGDTRAEYHHQNLGPCISCKRIPQRRNDPHVNPYLREPGPGR